MSELKLGEPIPTGIPGIEPVNTAEDRQVTDAAAPPFVRIASDAAFEPHTALFDQLFLFPMKLGLSIALASSAVLVNPALLAQRLETAGAAR